MKITSIGHAGFLIEAGTDIILADPWLNPAGAYAASWFPFPSNAGISPNSLERANILYISHWHQDHLDEWFLRGRSEKFKKGARVIIPNFKYKKLLQSIADYGYTQIEECNYFETIQTDAGTELSIIFDPNPLFVDSALLVRFDDTTFLDANDCKLPIADEEEIVRRYGTVDIFTAQFSGATFHPTCYTYDEKKKIEISTSRRAAKFERIVSSIERLGAKHYIPSAGPACFLSDDLFLLNLNPATVFSTSEDFRNYAKTKHPEILDTFVDLLPGDTLIYSKNKLDLEKSIADDSFLSIDYLRDYAKNKKEIIASEIKKYFRPIGNIVSDTKNYFRSLYNNVPELAHLAKTNLEIRLTGESGGNFFLDTITGEITDTAPDNKNQRYTLSLSSFWMRALLDELISWEDFILSFRFTLEREPDIYNEPIIAFLHLETKEERTDYVAYNSFNNSGKHERISRIHNGKTIEYDRYCPHNGEDLSCAQIENGILTCPRHFWQYSIEDGSGINNPATINIVVKN